MREINAAFVADVGAQFAVIRHSDFKTNARAAGDTAVEDVQEVRDTVPDIHLAADNQRVQVKLLFVGIRLNHAQRQHDDSATKTFHKTFSDHHDFLVG